MRYGVVADEREDRSLVLTTAGEIFLVAREHLREPGERDEYGVTGFARDPQAVRHETQDLFQRSGVRRAIRIVKRTDRTGSGVIDYWLLPLREVLAQSEDFSALFISYLEAEPTRKRRVERTLSILRKKAPKQYLVLMGCHLGSAPQSWLARSWGVKRQSVNELFLKSREFITQWIGDERA